MSSQQNTQISEYSWIDFDFLKSILNEDEPNVNNICQFNIQPALKNGENYSSCLLRITIDYNSIQKSSKQIYTKQFIVKASLGDKLIRSRDVFAKEIYLYNYIVNRIKYILQKKNMLIEFTPKCYRSCVVNSYLVLEDMTVNGFKNIDRKHGLNYNQLKLCLKSIALWHAASVKLIEEESLDFFKLYLTPHVSLTGTKHYRILFENAVIHCAHLFENRLSHTEIQTKLLALKETIFEKCCAAVERKEDELNVLNHGDLWSNNILFKENSDGAMTPPIFVDFQNGYIGSPLLDMSYFVFISANATVTFSEFDQLFSQYFDHLLAALNALEISKIPTKEQLYQQLRKHGCYGAYFSLFSVPMRILEPSVDNDGVKKFLSDSIEGRAFRDKLYSNKDAQISLKHLLSYFNDKHFLD